jgi:hypothetical protein
MHSISSKGAFLVVVQHPHPFSVAVETIIGGIQVQIQPLRSAEPEDIPRNLRGGISRHTIVMRNCHFVAMTMQGQPFFSAGQHA